MGSPAGGVSLSHAHTHAHTHSLIHEYTQTHTRIQTNTHTRFQAPANALEIKKTGAAVDSTLIMLLLGHRLDITDCCDRFIES